MNDDPDDQLVSDQHFLRSLSASLSAHGQKDKVLPVRRIKSSGAIGSVLDGTALPDECGMTDQEIIQSLRDRLQASEKNAAHWKSNHACEVQRARVLKDRLDMPLERVRAYAHIGNVQARNGVLSNALEKIIEMNQQYCVDRYDDIDRAESMSCVTVARKALSDNSGL